MNYYKKNIDSIMEILEDWGDVIEVARIARLE